MEPSYLCQNRNVVFEQSSRISFPHPIFFLAIIASRSFFSSRSFAPNCVVGRFPGFAIDSFDGKKGTNFLLANKRKIGSFLSSDPVCLMGKFIFRKNSDDESDLVSTQSMHESATATNKFHEIKRSYFDTSRKKLVRTRFFFLLWEFGHVTLHWRAFRADWDWFRYSFFPCSVFYRLVTVRATRSNNFWAKMGFPPRMIREHGEGFLARGFHVFLADSKEQLRKQVFRSVVWTLLAEIICSWEVEFYKLFINLCKKKIPESLLLTGLKIYCTTSDPNFRKDFFL